MSPASGDNPNLVINAALSASFHSINVPSEWGLYQLLQVGLLMNTVTVSIQLMSPASGDPCILSNIGRLLKGFHSINVPSEWGLSGLGKKLRVILFPFN